MELVLKRPGDPIYCPFHKAWEVMLDDPSLCDWCCQPKPCSMHDGEDHDEQEWEPERRAWMAKAIEEARSRHPSSYPEPTHTPVEFVLVDDDYIDLTRG